MEAWYQVADAKTGPSLARRITLAAFALASATMLALGLLAYKVSERQTLSVLDDKLDNLTRVAGQHLAVHLQDFHREIEGLARSSLVANALVDSFGRDTYLVPYLRDFRSVTIPTSDVALHDFRGRALAGSSVGHIMDHTGAPWAKAVLDGATYVEIEFPEGQIMLVVPVIYRATGAPEGMIVAHIDIAGFLGSHLELVGGDATLSVRNGTGRLLIGPERDPKTAYLERTQILAGTGPFADLGLVVEVRQEERQALAPVRELLWSYLAIGVVAALLVLVFAHRLGVRLTRPLEELGRMAQRVAASGSLDQEVPSGGPAETRRLADALKRMLARLKDSQRMLETRVEERTRDLAETRHRLASVLDSVEDSIWSVSPDWSRTLYVNEATARIYGRTPKDLAADPRLMLTAIHPADRPAVAAELTVQVQRARDLTYRIVRPDGGVRWINTRCDLTVGDKGAAKSFDGITSDVTERKSASDSLAASAELHRHLAEELKRSNAELEQFAYVASHDLQEPLRTVTSFLQLLEKRYGEKLDEDAKEFIQFAVDGGKRMQIMIEDLLAFSRIGTRGQPLAPTDSREALDRALQNLSLAVAEAEPEIEVGPMPRVMADFNQLTSLFQNLIANAIKYRAAGRTLRIAISAEKSGRAWSFSVADNGIGIEPQHYERIFVIFQRLHTRDKYPGSGIGLALCKKIVERHGGHIWVDSTPGEGAAFHFTLPAAETGEGSKPTPSAPYTAEARREPATV